jgi:REP element-mobilizing transposase RayT
MARPPRVPVMLPWECRVIYFITICITPRCNALANDAAWNVVCKTLDRLNKWNTYCIMTMPDHIHLLTAPLDRELRVAAFLKWFKRWFNESYGACEKWQWQPGGFDRLLRTSESIHEKWNYVRENPVRADLVAHWKQWPYQKDFPTTSRLSIGVSQKRPTKLQQFCDLHGVQGRALQQLIA